MLVKIKTSDLNYVPNINLSTKKHNLLIAPNGWGKTQLIKAIRSKLFEGKHNNTLKLMFTKEFANDPKGVYFIINEELDSRAVKDDVNPYDNSTFIPRTLESMLKSELSNGQDQKRTINMFFDDKFENDSIVFLDEPEKSLDIMEVNKLIFKLKKFNGQLFIVTHSPFFINDKHFNKIYLDVNYKNKIKQYLETK